MHSVHCHLPLSPCCSGVNSFNYLTFPLACISLYRTVVLLIAMIGNLLHFTHSSLAGIKMSPEAICLQVTGTTHGMASACAKVQASSVMFPHLPRAHIMLWKAQQAQHAQRSITQ